jgi:hypothetical protein
MDSFGASKSVRYSPEMQAFLKGRGSQLSSTRYARPTNAQALGDLGGAQALSLESLDSSRAMLGFHPL